MTIYNPRNLHRRTCVSIPGQRQIMFFDYATVATAAEVTAAGWFNGSRNQLTSGSIIDAVVDINGAIARLVLRVVTWSADPTVAITTAVDSGLSGS